MVLINYAGREINAKIVYYGPGLSGKTTNLECIYASVPTNSRGKMVSMKTRQDRTLFFDFLPLELGEVHGFRTRFLLYTVPGQVFYNATRKLVLKGADAVVFVADSGLGKMEENLESLRNLDDNLREQGLTLEGLPFVFQYNKRDLPEVYSVDELEKALNPRQVPSFEAAAASGRGVYETLHAVSRLLFQRLLTELRPGGARGVAAQPAESPGASAQAGGGPARPVVPAASRPPRSAPPAAPAPARAADRAQRAVAAPRVAAEPAAEARRAPEPGLLPEVEPDDAPALVPPQLFGSQRLGHMPQPPTTERILDSVQASAGGLEITEPEPAPHADSEYSRYGHVVDLEFDSAVPESVEPVPTVEPQPDEARPGGIRGLIKDPLRRREAQPSRSAAAGAPVVTKQATVVVSRSELQQGRSIRILLEVRVEP